MKIVDVVIAGALLAAAGCDRTHMSAHFGEANRDAFRAQVVHPGAGDDARPEPPLDPEEAAVIARAHIRALSSPSASPANYPSPFLVVPSGPASSAAPAPQEPPR